MRIFFRMMLLSLFGAAGVGIALGLGIMTDTRPDESCQAAPVGEKSTVAVVPRAPSPHIASEPFNAGSQQQPFEHGTEATEVELPQGWQVVADGPQSKDTNPPKSNQVESEFTHSTQPEVIARSNPLYAAESSQSQPAATDVSPLAAQAAPVLQWATDMLGTNASPKTNPANADTKKLAQSVAEAVPAGEIVDDNRTVTANAKPKRIQGLKVIGSGGNERLSINIQDADIREVLDLLGKQGNLNILTSNHVQGRVSATLSDVDLGSALDAILKSAGLSARREDNFIFVGTGADFEGMERSMDRVGTRVYRPNYIQASELETLIKPVLTQGVAGVGVVSVTSKAEQGIPADSTGSGGDNYAGTDAVVVRDFEAVLAEIDQLVTDIDVRPTQVQIEAMILSVELSDDFDFGVSFEVLRQFPHLRFGWGTPDSSLSDFQYDGGLKVAFLDDTLGAFIEALESVGDTDVIGTPRLLVVNKHRAEIQVGEQRGYVSTTQTETARTQSVEFLDLGIILRIRPFISSDGTIRMEVHPEISDGDVDVKEGFTLPNKQTTQVTTNVMVQDGCTVVIGGLLKEELKIDRTQVPLLGSLPIVGVAFRSKSEELKRRELIVLLTPHIVYEPDTCGEGARAACEFHRRQEVVREKASPLGKRSLGRRYFRKAQQAWAMGDRNRAMRLAEMSVNFDPNNRAAIELRSDIWLGRRRGNHTLPPASAVPEFEGPVQRGPLDGKQVPAWILEDLNSEIPTPVAGQNAVDTGETLTPIPMQTVPAEAIPEGTPLQHPIDPGMPGRRFDINRPQKLQPFY